MKKPVRITGSLTYATPTGCCRTVPAGAASLDKGRKGVGPYILSWTEHNMSFATELTPQALSECARTGILKA